MAAENKDSNIPILDTKEKVFQAIATVSSQIKGRLAKSERFQGQGGWSYVSVDDVLELVRPLASAAGLVITFDQEVADVQGGSVVIRTRAWGNGIVDLGLHTIISPCKRPQDLGGCQSYQLKYFYRELFSISLGETADLDAEEHRIPATVSTTTGSGQPEPPERPEPGKDEPLPF